MHFPPLPTPTCTAEEIAQMDLDQCIVAACDFRRLIGARAAMTYMMPPHLIRAVVYPSANSLTATLSGLLDRMREIVAEASAAAQDLEAARAIIELYGRYLFEWSDATVQVAAAVYMQLPVLWPECGPNPIDSARQS